MHGRAPTAILLCSLHTSPPLTPDSSVGTQCVNLFRCLSPVKLTDFLINTKLQTLLLLDEGGSAGDGSLRMDQQLRNPPLIISVVKRPTVICLWPVTAWPLDNDNNPWNPLHYNRTRTSRRRHHSCAGTWLLYYDHYFFWLSAVPSSRRSNFVPHSVLHNPRPEL